MSIIPEISFSFKPASATVQDGKACEFGFLGEYRRLPILHAYTPIRNATATVCSPKTMRSEALFEHPTATEERNPVHRAVRHEFCAVGNAFPTDEWSLDWIYECLSASLENYLTHCKKVPIWLIHVIAWSRAGFNSPFRQYGSNSDNFENRGYARRCSSSRL